MLATLVGLQYISTSVDVLHKLTGGSTFTLKSVGTWGTGGWPVQVQRGPGMERGLVAGEMSVHLLKILMTFSLQDL